jgi:radical SAM protein with 4Fe4S-binding SPASM domain
MLAEDLKQELSKKFRLITFADLADLRQRHRLIFDLFRGAYQDSFEPDQRLVLYSAYKPEQDFLDHIQRAAARVDISNAFILIVCPYDITDQLKLSNRKFGYDHSVIRTLKLPLQQTAAWGAPGFAKPDSLCALPFAQVQISVDGQVRPCCKFQGNIGNLATITLHDAFHGHKANTIRDQLRSGYKPKECSVCWQHELAGTTSYRNLAQHKYGDLLDQDWLDDVQIRDVTWSPATLCNFTCRICSADSSSSIAVEEIKWSTDSDQKAQLTKQLKIANALEKNLPMLQSLTQLTHLANLHILGGEPLLWPQLPDLVDLLVNRGLSENITLEFNTNCSLYPEAQILRIIENFKTVEILLSVDAVGPRFEIERGGQWSSILHNITKFASLKSSKVTITLAPTVNIQNVLYLDDVIDLAKTLGIGMIWWYLEQPAFLCIDQATAETKQAVIAKYLHHPEIELQRITARILNAAGSDGREFVAYTKKIDQRRSQRFVDTHPEIYRAMGGCD